MLFDLRGRGRRRTIQGVYLFLALLIGGGLIFFGVGGGSGSGGLLNAVNNNGTNAGSVFTARLKRDARAAAAQPSNAQAWAAVAKDHVQLAGENANSTTGTFNSNAVPDLRAAQQAWNRYVTLNPSHPDPHLAILLAQPLLALKDFSGAAAAFDIFVNSQPASVNLYAQLAAYRYAAHETSQGDLAAQKAIALAPKAQQSAVKQELAAIKQNAAKTSGAGSAPGTSGSGATSTSG